METVRIECGNCHRLMAISVEHLGGQVHCPHCDAIVQAPPARSPAPAVDVPGANGETESIFAGPESADDIFNTPSNKPLVEMPLERPGRAEDPVGTMPYLSGPGARGPDLNLGKVSELTAPASAPAPAAWSETSTVAEERPPDEADLAQMQRQRPGKQSAMAPILLIFLVPYALLATLVIAYLLYNQSRTFDPLERLPDPKPKDGGPRVVERVAHDSPLPGKLKARLKEPLQVGSLQVTPLKVQLSRGDELVLHLHMRNISSDIVFNPISDEFLKVAQGSMATSRPYTYLDSSQKKLYGGFPEWLKGPAGREEIFGGDIGPGQEELIRIATGPKYKADARRLAQSQENLVWRVQVRRGFLEVRGTQVSATAVVGVEFNARAIEKEG